MNKEIQKESTVSLPITTRETEHETESVIMQINDLSVGYTRNREFPVIEDVTVPIYRGKITAIIGHSGCGKSTFIRALNRMNEIKSANVWTEGTISFSFESKYLVHTDNIYDPSIDPYELRRKIGMVFQQPNVFASSIYDNVAYGPNILDIEKQDSIRHRLLLSILLSMGFTHKQLQPITHELVELSLKQAQLWDEVKNRLHTPAIFLSGGQQQRLCIARALSTDPPLLLMDEPCSNLDQISTFAIEEMIQSLHTEEMKNRYTTVIVTHNMEQAKRIADYVIVMGKQRMIGSDHVVGTVTEWGPVHQIFNNPQEDSTADFITGKL